MMKIFDNWRAAGYVPPVIRNNEPVHWFTLEFYEKSLGLEKEAPGPDETTQKTAQKSIQKTTQKQREILVYLKDHPGAGRKEISLNVTGITESGIRANLQALRRKGMLNRIGPDKGGHWEVLEKIDPEVQRKAQHPIETTQKTTQKQREILVYLKDHPAAGRKEIALNIGGITEDGIKKNLRALQQKNLLRRIGPAKGGYWEVVGMEEGSGVEDQAKDIGN